MQFSPQEANFTLDRVRELLEMKQYPPEILCRKLWMSLALIRSQMLTHAARGILGNNVVDGPFKGMKLSDTAYNSYKLPVALGHYEHELHGTVENIIHKNYKRIANIGCSVGYYAVGLALRMPDTVIDAYDIDDEARKNCDELAALNGVSERVKTHGLFEGHHFDDYPADSSLIFMDIEGGEVELLDPARYPALQKLDVVVELHDLIRPDLSEEISARFTATHDVQIIYNQNAFPPPEHLYKNVKFIDPFDQILMGWECRTGATPWGVFTAKK